MSNTTGIFYLSDIIWLPYRFTLLCLFSSLIAEFDETVVQSERFSAIKPGLILHFLHLKMPVQSQEYDSCCQFVFDVFCHFILQCDHGLSSEFSIFVIVLFFTWDHPRLLETFVMRYENNTMHTFRVNSQINVLCKTKRSCKLHRNIDKSSTRMPISLSDLKYINTCNTLFEKTNRRLFNCFV